MGKVTDKLKVSSITGFFAIVLLGVFYHDLYHWTNRSLLIAIMAPVNESVWEHLKLGLWALISFSVVEYFVVGKFVNNYFIAKAVGVLVISFTVLTVYYAYTTLLGRNIIALDITSYVLGVLLCQWVGYNLYLLKNSGFLNGLGLIILTGLVILFALFTFYPPETELFKDRNFNSYGIESKM